MKKKKKKRTGLKILLVMLVLLVLAEVGGLSWFMYRENHVFVDGQAYSVKETYLDLREEDISFGYYDELHQQLPDCEILWNVPFQGGKLASNAEKISVSSICNEDIAVLKAYVPTLKQVDASQCDDYAMLEQFKAQLPGITVDYGVLIGSEKYPLDTAELSLEPQDYTFDGLMDNLAYLPRMERITLHRPELTAEQMDALKEAYPQVAFFCTVEILGTEYDSETESLDLSMIPCDRVDEVCEKLSYLPRLNAVELVDGSGVASLSKEDAQRLMQAAPQARFHYVFEFFGQTLSTDDAEVRIVNKRIGNDGEAEVRQVLDLMTGCTRFVLENCQISNEIMASIRDDYRDRTKVVWRVYFGTGSAMTDSEVIRSVYDLVDDNAGDLKYCEDVRYMDIGHDEYLDEIPFIAYMPNLEVVIVSGAPIKDLSPFANCKKLKVLELANCGYVQDLSPLAGCESLELLNISYTKVKDLSALDELNITHLVAKGLYRELIPGDERNRFMQLHPDCWGQFDIDEQPYGIGWRYIRKNEPMDWYADAIKAFRYPTPPNDTGWYMD